jgi:hypothetical protein
LNDNLKRILYHKDILAIVNDPHHAYQKELKLMKKKCLLIIDESQWGQETTSIMAKFYKKVGIVASGNTEKWSNKNPYIISVSATAMTEVVNNNYKEYILLQNDSNYYGIREMFKHNRVYQAYDLNKKSDVKSFFNDIDLDTIVKEKKYIIIRNTGQLKKQTRVENNIDYYINKYDINELHYNSENKNKYNDDINNIIGVKPKKLTIVYIKDTLRAGKTMDTKYIMSVHDNFRSKSDATSQSLLGRCCGYNKKNHNVEIYCDLDAANQYRLWTKNSYDLLSVPKVKYINESIVKKQADMIPIVMSLCKKFNYDDIKNEFVHHYNHCNKCKIHNKNDEKLQLLNTNNIDNLVVVTKNSSIHDKNIYCDKPHKSFEKNKSYGSFLKINNVVAICVRDKNDSLYNHMILLWVSAKNTTKVTVTTTNKTMYK